MKTLNVTFTDKEYTELRKARQILNHTNNWENFILRNARAIIRNKIKFDRGVYK
jgi:predicted double-glycine peptidase